MNGSLNGAGTIPTPPPVSVVAFNVAKNGQSTGPFGMQQLAAMAQSGELLPNTLVWKQGMANWSRADAVEELKGFFAPPIV